MEKDKETWARHGGIDRIHFQHSAENKESVSHILSERERQSEHLQPENLLLGHEQELHCPAS